MSDKMRPVSFSRLIHWILEEYTRHGAIFNIPASKFYYPNNGTKWYIMNEQMDTPLGPAAGPHTQLAPNIVCAYLVGGRFFELKTVQKLDQLDIDKPCIDMEDEGYNVEWSQELTLEQSYSEYVKAWFILQLLRELFPFASSTERGFIFNMSVGYDLAGIQNQRVDRFIEGLKDASNQEQFQLFKSVLKEIITSKEFSNKFNKNSDQQTILGKSPEQLLDLGDSISPNISNSVTLSTMHGCPANEIEAIAKYLISEKGLHAYVKLNPTLLGYQTVKEVLDNLGYGYMELDAAGFDRDLQFKDAIPMIKRLKSFAKAHGKDFGVKLSNTLGMKNHKQVLPGDEMYMSGRSLFPLTINLAYQLASELDGDLNISYSGGAAQYNVWDILETGIYPVTFATDLLKPGGYERLYQMAETVASKSKGDTPPEKINLSKLKKLAYQSLTDKNYQKKLRQVDTLKIPDALPVFDCYVAPCTVACPIHQDVAEYIRLVEEGRYAEAFEVIVAKNPLPHITGYICDHQCVNKCTRWDYDAPLSIRELKKVAAEQGYPLYQQNANSHEVDASTGKRVAVIGAGPSGLSAAYFLAKAGVPVTVFDQTEQAGGTVQHIIPDFRLPQSAIDNDIEFIRDQGVHFQFNSNTEFSISSLKNSGFKYFYIAIGAGKSNRLPFSDHPKVFDAIEFLDSFHKKQPPTLGKKVAVIGGGNSAMDGARAALRCPGVETVTIIYRRTQEFMPADREEFDAARGESIQFKELLSPVNFENGILRCQKMQLGETDADGRRKVAPVSDSFVDIEANAVISAIGEHVDADILARNNLSLDHIHSTGGIVETGIENVFIGGDARRGPATVVEAIADGRKAAEEILKKEKIEFDFNPDFRNRFDQKAHRNSVYQKKGTLLTTQSDSITDEASRCLACNFICNKCVEVCPNRANIPIGFSTGDTQFRDLFQILHVDELCNECGNCETFCPYSGSPYKEKMTLFASKADFLESQNDGFYFLREDDDTFRFEFRYHSHAGEIGLLKDGTIISDSGDPGNESAVPEQLYYLLSNLIQNYAYLFSHNNN